MQPIRALERDEWERGRHLRLRALADAPDAFRSTYEAVSAESDAWWRDLVETFSSDPNRGIWVVESSGELVGMALGNIHQGTLHIFSMWVVSRSWSALSSEVIAFWRDLVKAARFLSGRVGASSMRISAARMIRMSPL